MDSCYRCSAQCMELLTDEQKYKISKLLSDIYDAVNDNAEWEYNKFIEQDFPKEILEGVLKHKPIINDIKKIIKKFEQEECIKFEEF